MLCRIYRWLISRSLDADAPPGPRLRRHLDACDECRRRYDGLAALGDRLRAEVPGEQPLPLELRERIRRAVRAEHKTAQRPVAMRLSPVAWALAAAACALLAVGVFLATRPPDRPHVVAKAPDIRLPTDLLEPRTLIDESLAQVREIAAGPFADEMARLARDAGTLGRSMLAPLPLELVALD